MHGVAGLSLYQPRTAISWRSVPLSRTVSASLTEIAGSTEALSGVVSSLGPPSGAQTWSTTNWSRQACRASAGQVAASGSSKWPTMTRSTDRGAPAPDGGPHAPGSTLSRSGFRAGPVGCRIVSPPFASEMKSTSGSRINHTRSSGQLGWSGLTITGSYGHGTGPPSRYQPRTAISLSSIPTSRTAIASPTPMTGSASRVFDGTGVLAGAVGPALSGDEVAVWPVAGDVPDGTVGRTAW